MSLTSVASIASIASISSISFWSVLSTSTHTSSRTTSTSDFSPTVPPTQRNSTHTTVIIAGAAGGVLALVIFSALLFYCLRFRGSGGQGGADLKGPVAPVPLGGHAGFTGANMGMVGGNVHTLVYPSPGSMTGHHTSDTGGGSGYDNLLTEAANPGNASPPNSPISAGVGSGPSRVANPGSDSSRQSGERSSQGHRGISFPDSSPLGRNPGEGPTVQMSVLRSAPHPVPDGKPEYPYGIPELG
ncbi:uncharacterized protein EI90DRAFT_3067902 [Cantharellus anzutake]|uniref:uncharacterized protein n=1 Tax=Cantharellus anzutake TaxID=1750568 RepID=UPI0019043018|nr:uncharacterized protein EI90DRAFT_3067902 [Cantharellus anzutake]KAF8327461.1 hypothetical protein EI90DRAFT_3067902 [Cantharellus anzutake]